MITIKQHESGYVSIVSEVNGLKRIKKFKRSEYRKTVMNEHGNFNRPSYKKDPSHWIYPDNTNISN